VEGLTIAYGPNRTGYLLASSQGNNSYTVYLREGSNHYIRTFRVKDGNGIDGTQDTDGIDVTTANLGSSYPNGLFVAQDGSNTTADGTAFQNYKLVPLQYILQP
jgi:3-phytase